MEARQQKSTRKISGGSTDGKGTNKKAQQRKKKKSKKVLPSRDRTVKCTPSPDGEVADVSDNAAGSESDISIAAQANAGAAACQASDPQRQHRSLQSNSLSKSNRTRQVLVCPPTSQTNNTHASTQAFNESLRWEYTLEDATDEAERIRQYKANRRKRYLAAFNLLNSSNWASANSSGSSSSLSPSPGQNGDGMGLPDVVMSSVTPSQLSDSQIILQCP